MLREIKTDKHSSDPLQRIWFSDQDNDLFIWLDDETPVAFQFSYNKRQDEHTLNWQAQRGYSHQRIDNGEDDSTNYKMTPIMIPNGMIDRDQISHIFKSISHEIEPQLAEFISRKLDNAPLDI